MPNEFDTNKNQLDLFSYAESKQNQQDKRQKLASSGFTATVWTLSGVVLAACSLFQDDEGPGGGSVSVNASPVRDARLYFDIDGDGDVDEDDVRIQNEQYPGGFTTGSDGRATGIPLELLGRPYIADLNGATDAATEHPLEGQYHSLEDEDGNHLIASPITALIAEAMADTNQPNTVSGVVAAFTPSGIDADDILAELRNRDSYLPGTESSERVIALSKYLADNKAREVVGREDTIAEQIAESQRIIGEVESGIGGSDAIVVVNEDADTTTPDVVDVDIEVGEHDSYVGIINAFAQDGSQLSYTLTETDGSEYAGVYTINARGGISFADSTIIPVNVAETFNVEISNGNPADTQIVVVDITVDATVYQLSLDEGREVGTTDENVISTTANPVVLIEGIEVDDTAATAAGFEIRDNALGIFADKFEVMEDTTNQAWNLQLKNDEYLDYEAIPGGEIELYVSVDNGANGHHSNILTVTIMVSDDPNDISFSGTLRADLREDDTTPPSTHLIAEGQVTIENHAGETVMVTGGTEDPASDATQTILDLTYGTFTYNHETNAWTYTVDNSAAAIQALFGNEAGTDIVTLAIDGGNGITHTRNIVLNVHGENEDVHYVDAITGQRVDGSDANIEIGDPEIDGTLDLGNIFDGLRVENQLAGSATPTVTFAETDNADVLARQNLFTLSPDGALVFVGNDDDVANLLGNGIALDLVISAPDDTNEPIPFRLSINVVNEDDDGDAAYEIMGSVELNGELRVERTVNDPDGIRGTESYQWFRGDETNPNALLGNGPTYTVTAADLASGDTIGVIVEYTDGSNTPERIVAFASPVSIPRPNAADLLIDEGDASWSVSFTATSEDASGVTSDIASYEFVLDGGGTSTTHPDGFTISQTGQMATIRITSGTTFDFEDSNTPNTYNLRVRATDSRTPDAESATRTLTININDVNDNAPVFDPNQVTTVAIDETLGNGQSVGLSVAATDADGTTANSTVTYSVTGGTGMGIFDVDSSSGVITVLDASMIDFESGTTSYTLIIGASDGLDASGTDDPTFTADTTTTITININDVNDESPTVPNPVATGSARITAAADNPSSGPGTGMGYTVTVSDADADATSLDVSLTSGDPRFEFVRQTGTNTWELYLIAGQEIALSELNDQLSFEYIVTDSGVGTTSVTGSFVLTVVDTPVEFTSPAVTTIPLDENNAANLAVATVTATSEDTDGNTVHIASFTLVNDFGGLFSISTSNLGTATAQAAITIASANALDFEATESYSLQVVATDANTPPETNTLTLTINVGNEDEGNANYAIAENQAGTELSVALVDPNIDDPDVVVGGVSFRWFTSMDGGVTKNYISGANSATLDISDPTQLPSGATYGVTISYTDRHDVANNEMTEFDVLASSVSFDANFARTGILEETHSGGTLSYSANAEVTTATDTIAVSATSVTPGNPTITYDFASGGNPNNYFAIRANGAITWARETTFDFETLSEAERTLEIVVIATEVENSGTGQTGTGDTARVSIILTIQNEQEGDGTYIIQGNVAAGAELTAVVTDPDGTRSVTYEWYSLDSSGGDRQVIAATQSIMLPGAADFDDTRTYHVTITHTDNLGDRHEETLDASAVVFDIQKTDNTAFPSSIAENTDSLPVVVATLDGDTRSPTYTFVGGDTSTTSGVFTISQSGSTAGAITVNAPSDINFETAQEFNDGSRGYTLNVRATFAEDTANNLPEVTGDVVVTIIVTDVNEHAPVFVAYADDNTLSTGTDEIAEDAANGTRVGLFRATDADGSNNDVTYSLDDGGLGVFGIREVTGTNNWEIYVLNNANLDYDPTTTKPTPTRSYTIEITATDSDPDNAMSSAAEAFTINITDVNDNDPVLGAPVWRSTYETSVPEDTGSGVHLFTVTATDADTATTPPPTLTYRIVTIDDVAYDSATAIFGINGSNGEVGIALDNALDRETKASHKIVIEAFDEGVRTSNQQTVIVTVGDVNEHKPVLGEPEWVSDYGDNGVPEDAYTGAPLQIFTATATDRDATNNGFSYEIVSVDGVTYDSSTSIFAIRAGRVGITSALDYATAPEIMDDTNTVIGRGHEIVIVAIDNSGTGMRSEPGTITVLVANRDDGPAVFEVSPTQANDKILEVEVDTADPDGLDGTYSYQWFTTTDDGVTQVDITNENGRRFDTSGRTDPAGTVYGVRVEYTDNAGTEYSQANGNAPFAVNTTLRFTESYSITLTDGNASPTLPVFADDLELNGDAITTGLEFTFATNGNPGNLFTLSSAGVLTFTGSAVDFDMATDAEKSFNLIIVAEATAGGETTTAIIPVTVEDVNDNDPTLSEPFDTASAANDPRTALSTDDIDEGAGGVGATTSISFEASDADTVFSGAGQTELEFTITATAGTTDAQDIADMFEMAYDSTNDIYTLRLKDGMALNAEAAGLTTNGGVQQIELRIQATDGRTDMPTATPTAGQGLSDARTVTITVNDVNDFDPVFRNGAEHTETISEEMAVGTTVVSANPAPARDGDATAANRDLEYSIVRVTSGGVVTGAEFFTLDTSTGGITLAQKLDYESTGLISNASTDRGYVIELLVKDQDDRQDTQMLTVVVTDEDDTDPAFGTLDWGSVGTGSGTTGEEHIRNIGETTTGTLLTIPISDADTDTANLILSIQGGGPMDSSNNPIFVFERNGNNAELRVNPSSKLNYDTDPATTSYSLTLVVADSNDPTPRTATQDVVINLDNENDETPTFADPVVTWEAGFTGGVIPETTDGSTTRVLVGRVAISDADNAFLDDRTFAINGAGSKFVIERNADTTANDGTLGEGLIYLTGALEREGVGADPAEHAGVTIMVDDGVNPAVTSAAFDIEISDVNEYDPVISPGAVLWNDPDVTGGAINEGSYSAGTTIAFATVTDADATNPAPLEFTLTKGDSIFSISNTGVITLKANTDLDADSDPTSYTLAYTVQNVGGNPGGNPIASGDITLTVTNINDNDPEYITGVTTGDPKVIWETGFPGGNILENTVIGTTLGKIQVRDADMDELMFEVVATPDGINTIDSKFEVEYEESTGLGLLKLKTALDLDDPDNPDPSTIGLQVIISDEDNDPNPIKNAELSDVGNLIIVNIQPVNEHMPALNFSGSKTTVNIDEQMPPSNGNGVNTGISFTVDDADSKIYRINDFDVSGDSRFRVEWSRTNQEGSIWLKAGATLDYEKTDPMDPTVFPDRSITLTLRVDDDNDADGNPVFATETLTINVDPTDDENPGFGNIAWIPGATTATTTDPTEANTMRTIREDSTATLLGTFLLTDGDGLSNLNDVSIDASGNPTDENGVALFTFTRNGASGVLSLNPNADLDYEHMTSHDLVLVVTDGANTPGVHRVTINVAPVDEGDAVFAITSDNTDLSAPAVGDTLTVTKTADDPDRNPVAPNTFNYKWFRYTDGADITVAANRTIIASAIGTTYELQGDDAGNRIGVLVEYTDAGGHTESLPFAAPLTADVAADFEVTGGAMGTAEQYDTSPVDATGTLTFGTESAMDVDSTGTYTIASQGTYGTVSLVPVNSDMSMGPIVTPGTWTYNVDNTDAAVKALRASDTTPLTDTFKIGVPLTAAAGGGVQEVTVTVDISGVATGAEIHGTSAANTGRSPGNPLDRSASTTFDVIQGGNGEDEIWTGSGGSLVIAGYGGDTITLGDGADTVVHRFFSTNDGAPPAWRLDGGDDTIHDFEPGVDKLVLVDTDTVSPVTREIFLDETKSSLPTPTTGGAITIQLAYTGLTLETIMFTAMTINIQGKSTVNGPNDADGDETGTEFVINFKDPIPLAGNEMDLAGIGTPGAGTGGFLSGQTLTKFSYVPNYFDIDSGSEDHFDVISLAELGIKIEDFA